MVTGATEWPQYWLMWRQLEPRSRWERVEGKSWSGHSRARGFFFPPERMMQTWRWWPTSRPFQEGSEKAPCSWEGRGCLLPAVVTGRWNWCYHHCWVKISPNRYQSRLTESRIAQRFTAWPLRLLSKHCTWTIGVRGQGWCSGEH